MAKSMRSKRERRLRTKRREIVKKHYEDKATVCRAVLEAIVAAPSPYVEHADRMADGQFTAASEATDAQRMDLDASTAKKNALRGSGRSSSSSSGGGGGEAGGQQQASAEVDGSGLKADSMEVEEGDEEGKEKRDRRRRRLGVKRLAAQAMKKRKGHVPGRRPITKPDDDKAVREILAASAEGKRGKGIRISKRLQTKIKRRVSFPV